MNKVDTFANRLRTALKLRGMKQVELCEITGLGKSSLSQYLSGEYEPRVNRVAIIANVLDVNIYWLMGFDVPMDREAPLPSLSGTQFEGMSKSQMQLFLLSQYLQKIDEAHPNLSDEEKRQYIAGFYKYDVVELMLDYMALNDRDKATVARIIKSFNDPAEVE